MTFDEIKTLVRKNLEDANVTFYSTDDINDSIQDGYNDIAARALCIVKKAPVDWQQGLVYYDVTTLNVPDYLAATAVYNNNNNRFLDDDINIQQLERFKNTWELTKGTPSNWMPVNNKYFAIYPIYGTAFGTFDLFYWAKAPTVIDTDTPLIAVDMHSLLEIYSTADLIEQGEEYQKAELLWAEYFNRLQIYKDRCETMSKTDLLMLA